MQKHHGPNLHQPAHPTGRFCGRAALRINLAILLASVAALLALSMAAAAQEAVQSDSPAMGAASPPTVTQSDALYDVNASGVDIKFVLEALARRSGVNIVVSPEVTGEITAHLTQLPVEAILEHLSTVQGFGWRKTDGTYLVADKERFKEPEPVEPVAPPLPPEVLVWDCRYSSPSHLMSVVTDLFPEVKVSEGPASVIPELDDSNSVSASSGGTSSSETTRENRTKLILMGQPDQIARVKDVLEKLDVPVPQVSIEVAVAEVSASADKEVGIEWSWSDVSLTESAPASGIRFGKFTKSAMTFKGVISALMEDDDANLLAKPNLSVVDGACAEILIGDRLLFPKLVGYSDFGTPIYDKEEERVGIYLQITPKVSGDQVVMTLYPQVSLVTSYLSTQAGDYPQISTRETKTTVSVKSGQTLAIGGLLREDEIRNASKIPLLGDLPIIGSLFRHTKTTKERTEIVIFLTPRIMEESQ